MRIGLYNRHLATLGGGERYSLSIAALLAANNPVEVISHTPVAEAAIAERLHLGLGGAVLRVVPERTAAELSDLSAEYDLFINASNGDFIAPHSPYAALVIYFPTPPDHGPTAHLRRYVGQELTRAFLLPHWLEGVYGERDGVRLLAPRAVIRQPAPQRLCTLHFSLRAALPLVQQVTVTVDDAPALRVAVGPDFVPCTLALPASADDRVIAIRTEALDGAASYALELAGWSVRALGQRAYHEAFAPRLPGWDARLRNPQPPNLVDVARLYPLRWSISRFTQHWTERTWGLPSELLYPPVDVERFAPVDAATGEPAKKPIILSVGRFFAGQHNKQHLFMVDAFRRLVDGGLRGWELHLVGGVNAGPEHAAYLQAVRTAARGYPIRIETDLPFDQLAQRYADAALYWHAAGCTTGPDDHPIRAEHFGITTVEAMAAGCVPIVAARGGQPELVTQGVDGWLWESQDELCGYTTLVIGDEARRQHMAAAARAASRRFSLDRFRRRLYETLAAAHIPVATPNLIPNDTPEAA